MGMKTIEKILCGFLCLLMIIGCDDKDYKEPISTLQVVEANLNVKAVGGDAFVVFLTDRPLTVELESDWCLLKEVNKSKIILRALPNYGYSSRTAQLTVSDGNESKNFTINQEGAVLAYEEDDWILRTTNDVAEFPVKLYGSFDCIINIPEHAKNWLSFERDADGEGGKFIVTENTTGDMRGAIVRVVSGKRQTTYRILQSEIDNYLGTWNGQFNDGSRVYAPSGVSITQESDGAYVVSNLFTALGFNFTMKGRAVGNEIVFEAGQYLGTDGSYYYGFGVISAEGQFIEDSSGTISLGPVILKNGQIAIGFIGIKETDPMGFGLMAYTDEFMDEVYTYKAILDCVLYK
jgi:hypothetical protein